MGIEFSQSSGLVYTVQQGQSTTVKEIAKEFAKELENRTSTVDNFESLTSNIASFDRPLEQREQIIRDVLLSEYDGDPNNIVGEIDLPDAEDIETFELLLAYEIFGVPNLEMGSSGDYVKNLQQALLAEGYYQLGDADGEFGPKTKEALRSYQKH
ncbi:MAG TPA: peptidoglycan-binding domain-containing protein, partial [Vampirovibrionales bacterium]